MATLVSPARRTAHSEAAAEIVDCVHDAMKSIFHHAQPELEAAGISMSQFWALHIVTSLDGASVGKVSRHLSVSAPSASASLDQLESAGLVVRHRSAQDRRAVEISITPKGRKVESRVWSEIARLMADASADVPEEDLAAAARLFRAVRKELDRRPSPPGVPS